MSLAFRNEIDITVSLAARTVSDVAILPRSRPPLTRLFAGKPAGSLAAVLPRLFSLCAVAHQVAFLTAVEAARGSHAAPEVIEHRITAVIVERLAELVRGLFIARHALDRDSAAAVRAIMQATTILASGAAEHERDARREAVLQIRTALRTLGIEGEDHAPAPAAQLASFDTDVLQLLPTAPLFLSTIDDLEIVTRLLAGGAGFSDAPELFGEVPETGVWARRAGREPAPDAGPIERLKARVTEIARLCAWLGGDDEAVERHVAEGYRLGAGKGAAAVECARGRLYHAVELDDEDRIVRFEFLAPTEWNFHARGPLVRSLRGATLAAGQPGQDAVRHLVESFDPCVGFSLSFREVGHA